MAQTSNDILSKILGVCTQINSKLDGSKPSFGEKSSKKSDKGTGSLFNSFGSGKVSKDAKKGGDIMKGVVASLSTLAVIKFRPKTFNKVTLSIRGLFDVFKEAGDEKRTINKGIKLFSKIVDALKESAPAVDKHSKAFSRFMKSIGIGFLLIAGGLFAAMKLLGANSIMGALGIVAGVVIGMVGLMYLMAKTAPYIKDGINAAKDMGKAMTFIGFGLIVLVGSLKIVSMIAGGGGIGAGAMLAVGIITATSLVFYAIGKFAKPIVKGAITASFMGIGMAAIALGMISIGYAAKYLTNLGGDSAVNKAGEKKGKFGQMMSEVGPGLGLIGIVMVSSALLFSGLGLLASFIIPGVITAGFMALGWMAIAGGMMVLGKAAKALTGMGDQGAMKSDGVTKKGKFGQMMSEMGPGLGLIGIVLVSSALLFSGLALISPLVIAGSVTAMAIGGTLVVLGKSVKSLMDATKGLKGKDVRENIQTITGSVLTGFIEGVGGALSGGKGMSLKGLANSMKNTAIITGGITMLMGVSLTLSQFAKAISAFAELNNMKVIESFDKDGKPKFGATVNVQEVGKNITATISTFLVGLIDSTENLKKGQAKKIKRMGRALTGKRGILTAVIQFADVLKTYAQFGPKGEIGFVDMVPDGTDQDGNIKYKQVASKVKITTVSKNVAASIGTFMKHLSESVEGMAFSGSTKRAVSRMAEVLLGKKRSAIGGLLMSDKPGLLEPIDKFANTLMIYSKFGDDGTMPVFDKDGNPTDKKLKMADVAKNIAVSISTFSTSLATEMEKVNPNAGKKAGKQMKQYSELISQLSDLGNATEKLMNTSTAIESLAQGIGNLAANLNLVDGDKLNTLTGGNDTTAKLLLKRAALKFGDTAVSKPPEAATQSSGSQVINNISNKSSDGYKQMVDETKKLREAIENKVDQSNAPEAIAAAISNVFNNSQFHFDFQTDKSGVMSID